MKPLKTDILIIGSGLTGLSLLLALTQQGLDALLIDTHVAAPAISRDDFNARSLALAPASVNMLSHMQIWESLLPHATPIQTIHVSQRGSFGTTRLKAADKPLGYVIEMRDLIEAFSKYLPQKRYFAQARLLSMDTASSTVVMQYQEKPLTIQARLIVSAEGSRSQLREWLHLPIQSKCYDQVAVTANIGLARPHHHIAYERFSQEGPLAMLPMSEQRAAMIWCMPPEQAQSMKNQEDAVFLANLQRYFGYRLGRFTKLGKRTCFPLYYAVMPYTVKWPVVFIGNAAHTLHPIAGQGFNLALRDAASLVQCILKEGLTEAMLQSYQAMRSHDQKAIAYFTQGLIQVFKQQLPGAALFRSFGLLAFDQIPALKSLIAHYARGYGGQVPDLVCGISLHDESI